MSGGSPPCFPARISRLYQAESCLASREGRSVWRMRRKDDGALFILKLSLEETEDFPEEFKLLQRLAPLLPGAVPAPADCFWEDGTHYLLRSYLPGETLAQYRSHASCGAEWCAETGRKVCALLDTLHTLSPPIIHRDIKPENILLLPNGGVGLIDFGIARQYKPAQSQDTRRLGTRSTAAPEQYGYAQTDCRTDLYALAMTLIWLLTGEYDQNSLRRCAHVPRRLRRVLAKGASFSPKDRYQSAAAFSAALAAPPVRRRLAWAVLPLLLAGGLCLWGGGERSVSFGSQSLELAVRAELGQAEGPVTYRDLERVERLAVTGQAVFSREELFDYRIACYTGGAYQGEQPWGDVGDLSLLSRMPHLRELYLCRQNITDLSPLKDLPLTTLALCENKITDLSPLQSMTSLDTLYLGGNPISDGTPLSSLTGLRLLNLDGTVSGYAMWDSFSFLESLSLRDLSLGRALPADGDWSPLRSQKWLERLALWEPPEEALAAANTITGLRLLNIGDYTCPDLEPFSRLEHLEVLNIFGGRLERLDGADALSGLITLAVGNSAVSDLSPLAGLPKLDYLQLSSLPISDFSPLADLPALAYVRVDGDQAAAVEADCPGHSFQLDTN